jgi:hypothetical protein
VLRSKRQFDEDLKAGKRPSRKKQAAPAKPTPSTAGVSPPGIVLEPPMADAVDPPPPDDVQQHPPDV